MCAPNVVSYIVFVKNGNGISSISSIKIFTMADTIAFDPFSLEGKDILLPLSKTSRLLKVDSVIYCQEKKTFEIGITELALDEEGYVRLVEEYARDERYAQLTV